MTIKGEFAAFSDNSVMSKCTLYLLQTCKSQKTWVVPKMASAWPAWSTPVLFFPQSHPSSALYCGSL